MKNLDKEEFRVKLEEINHLVEQKDYKGAMNVVDSIDWRRVKNVRTLCVVGEIYAANKRYEDSKEIFLLAYHRASIGKNILYRLVEVSLKLGQIQDATEFYQEYKEVAPNDNNQYILQYKILKEKKAPLAEQIKILEIYKGKEFTEKWSYELAKLYYQAGEKDKCLELCNDIILWFSEGSYVLKAMDLKQRMGALTGAEKERYEQQFVPKLMKPEEAENLKETKKETKVPENPSNQEIENIQIKTEDLDKVESLQEKISRGLRDIFGSRKMDEMEEGIQSSEEEKEVEEEMLRNPSTEKEYDSVPDLEPESGKAKVNLSETIKMPSLKIPKSMKNLNTEEMAAAAIPKAPVQNSLFGENDIQAEEKEADETTASAPAEEKKDFGEFNLEDTILAAATAQGIEIPKEHLDEAKIKEENEEIIEAAREMAETPAPQKNEKPAEEIPEEVITPEEEVIEDTPVSKKKHPIVELEEEEFLSEEDLQAAEDEFMNGPAGKNIHKEDTSAPSLSEEDFIANMLKDSMGQDEDEDRLEEESDEDSKEDYEEESDEDSKEDYEEESDEDSQEDYEEESDEDSQEDYEEESEEEPQKADLSEEDKLEQFIDSIQPKEKHNPTDIIPREKKLTDDEKKLFTYFVKIPGMKEQLISTLCDVQMAAADKTSKTGNVIVMGGRETGKTRLIASLIPAICKELNLPASKVAYVFADQLNDMDVAKVMGKLLGGFLVIENANQLTQETVDILDKAMEFRTDGLTVIIEDEKIGMRKLMARFPKFAKKFTSMINIPVFTNDELVNFARVYTKENGYKIDQMGMLALYDLIGKNQKEDQPMNIGAVKEMLDAAIAKSQGGLLKFNKKKRVDRDGFTILYEKDFTK